MQKYSFVQERCIENLAYKIPLESPTPTDLQKEKGQRYTINERVNTWHSITTQNTIIVVYTFEFCNLFWPKCVHVDVRSSLKMIGFRFSQNKIDGSTDATDSPVYVPFKGGLQTVDFPLGIPHLFICFQQL